MTLKRCSLAGVDDSTPLFELAVLSDLHPFAEWGFLYSPGRQGQRGRHASVERIQRALRELPGYVKIALHLRDEGVNQLLRDEAPASNLLTWLRARGGRVVLDGDLAARGVERAALRRFFVDRPDITFITRHDERNAAFTLALAGVQNHAVLLQPLDRTAPGPLAWPVAPGSVACGYAANLGPETLGKALPGLYQAAGGNDFWIELEDRIRDPDDRFDLHAARACLEIVGSELSERRQAPRTHPRRRQCELSDLVGLTHDEAAASEFEIMLQRLVDATGDVLDPHVLEMRRKAENLLRTRGSMSLMRPPGGGGGSFQDRRSAL